MSTTPEVLEGIDGRTARRDRNRSAVLDAVLALFAEGNLFPSAEAVAERSGVSLRSVYRYVADADDLVRAAIDRHREQVAPLFEIANLGTGDLEGRIRAICESRVHAYDEVAPTARASRARAYSNEIIRRQLDEASALLRDQVAKHFDNELREMAPDVARATLASVDALLQHETIELYRVRRRHSSTQTIALLVVALGRLLREGGA